MNDFDVVGDSEGEELEFAPSKAAVLSSIETDTGGSRLRHASSIVTASLGASLTAARTRDHQELDALASAKIPNMDLMDFPDLLSIADRAKTRQRSTKRPPLPTPGSSTRVLHPFDEDTLFDSYHIPDTFGGDDNEDYAASRSKPKPKPKLKQKQKKLVVVRENLDSLHGPNSALPGTEMHISERDPSSPPPPQSRPRPRPIKRIPKTSVEPSAAVGTAGNSNQEQQPTSELSLPAPTSPLPPSDPPPSTSTMLNDHMGSMPPITTLPDPPSSPSSLFSIGDKGTEDVHIPNVEDDPLLMEPPSTFFTGTSSPDQPPQQPNPRGKLGEPVGIIDLCTAPPQSTGVEILAVKKAPSSKKGKEKSRMEFRGGEKSENKAKGKRKARDGEEFEIDMASEDEYEGGRKAKKKAAASKRGKEKKPATSKASNAVIDSRPRNALKRGGKGRAKKVEDSPRDDDPECRPRISTFRDKSPARPPNLSAGVKDPEAEAPPNFVPGSEGEDVEANTVSPRNVITAPKSSGRKRRSLAAYDEDETGGQDGEESSSPKKKAKTRCGTQANGKAARQKGKRVVSSDEEEDDRNDGLVHRKKKTTAVLSSDEDVDDTIKENVLPQGGGTVGNATSSSSKPKPPPPKPVSNHNNGKTTVSTGLTSRYTIAPRTKLMPMSELIRRVNSLPQTPAPASKDKAPPVSGITYSPYTKSSRSFLSKIAPLHPNRRTPPPPPPPPPPRKKSKKEIEREERWEEELIENVGGPAAWSCLSEEERKVMRRGKWAMEMGFDD